MPNPMKVVNVRGRKHLEFGGESGVIYVGRAVPRAGYKLSEWANPWTTKQFGTAEACVKHYAAMVKLVVTEEPRVFSPFSRSFDPFEVMLSFRKWMEFRAGIETASLLAGRTLGCWCCDWDGTCEPSAPCHAVVLWKLANLGVQSI